MKRNSLTVAAPAAAAAMIGGVIAVLILQHQLSPDFRPMWAALQTSTPYDGKAVTAIAAAGIDHFNHSWSWLYPYPPTFLVLTAPLGWLAFPAALIGWCAISGAAFAASTRLIYSPLLIFTPAALLAMMAGQTSLMVGALALGGVQLLHRPRLAGLLIGMAACIKPQFLLLLPIVMIAARAWPAMFWTLATGAAVCGVATMAHGPHVWLDWIAQFGPEMDLVATISPHLDIGPLWARALVLVAGAPLLWLAGRRQDMVSGVCAVMALGLMTVPGSLWYGAAMASPACLVLISRLRLSALPAIAFLILWPTTITLAVLLAAVVVELFAPWELRRLLPRRVAAQSYS